MDDLIIDKYVKAGKAGAEIKTKILEEIKPGMKILGLAEKIENMINDIGFGIAFPVNIGINEVTAHYTPSMDDDTVIAEGDLVKIDTGLHLDGYVADMAYTFCTDKNNEIVKTSIEALNAAIDIVKPGVKVSTISEAIYEAAKNAGLGVITNLTGHSIERYVIHGPPNIHNKPMGSNDIIEEGTAIAIEPFITDSDSIIKESNSTEIYSFLQPKPVRMKEAREILEVSAEQFKGLPFAKRWIEGVYPKMKLNMALRQLEDVGALHGYPVLKETRGKPVAQAEHTILVLDVPIVTTK